MKIGLVGPIDCSINGNPGWHMITGGIRWLVRQVHPNTAFIPVNMNAFDDSWEAAKTCEVVIICGNPRFSSSLSDAFWEHDMWHRLSALIQQGVRVIDGWAGTGFPYSEQSLTADEMAVALMFLPNRLNYLEIARTFHGRITRDATMQRIYERYGLLSVLLPCSSWWARDEFNIKAPQDKTYDALVLHQSRHTGWFHDALNLIIERKLSDRPLHVVASTWGDYKWAKTLDLYVDVELITDPASLLRFYGRAGNVLSFRLHAAIPAASMGCAATIIAIDSRADTCKLFGIPVVRFTDIPTLPPFILCTPPDTAQAVHELAKLL